MILNKTLSSELYGSVEKLSAARAAPSMHDDVDNVQICQLHSWHLCPLVW